jgi:hypothetical protein
VIALLAAIAVLTLRWPFREAAIRDALQQRFQGQVKFSGFQETYWPRPGCIATNLDIRRPEDDQPVVHAQRISIQGSYFDFLKWPRRVALLEADGLRVHLDKPKPGNGPAQKAHKLIIEEFRTNNAVLETHFGGEPVSFHVHQLRVDGFGGDRPASFDVELTNPQPKAEIAAQGKFGPIAPDAEHTHVEGDYSITHVDLSKFEGISGTASAKGHFDGIVAAIRTHGDARADRFEVGHTSHAVDLVTHYDVTVNGTSGDVVVNEAATQLRRTTLHSHGTVAGSPDKAVKMEFEARGGRIEDLLYLFVKSEPAMQGNLDLNARAELPPGKEKFIRRVRLDGVFGIDPSQFTKSSTQGKVDELSARARGDKQEMEDPERVVSDLRGHARLRDGVAELSEVSFSVPGATARGGGTYSLITHDIDMQGLVRMQADISEATKGIKSVLLKPLAPIFRHRHAGAVLPVKMTGRYPNPQITIGPKPKMKHDHS